MSKKSFLLILLLISIIIQVYFRYNLSLNRYFDVDEYAHLHWANSFVNGLVPYRDFFYIFPPFFLIPVGLIIKVFGASAATLIKVRGFIFLVQVLTNLVLFIWVRKLRGIFTAAFSVLIFIFMPLPSDKLLEIRPDLLAFSIGFLGLYLFIQAEEQRKAIFFFLTGFLFSISILIVPKTVFLFVPPILVLFYNFLVLKKESLISFWKNIGYLILGFSINIMLFIVFLITSGKFLLALYFITKLASDATGVLAAKFYMRPDIFFYPNDTYYGLSGLSQTLIANLLIYILGSVWGIKNLISSLSHDDKNRNTREFVFALTLVLNLFAFVKIFPLKHLQYLIPVSPFIAFYFADFLVTALGKIRNSALKFCVYLFLIGYTTYLSYLMYKVKLPWNNKSTLNKVSGLLSALPKTTAVFDLTGETIFYPDGYYFCCLPYGQYEEVLNFPYPQLESELKKRGTIYIHIDSLDRLGVLPAKQGLYIKDNYKESNIPGMLIKK